MGESQYPSLLNFGMYCDILHPCLYDLIVGASMHMKAWLCSMYVVGRYICMWFDIWVPFHS